MLVSCRYDLSKSMDELKGFLFIEARDKDLGFESLLGQGHVHLLIHYSLQIFRDYILYCLVGFF